MSRFLEAPAPGQTRTKVCGYTSEQQAQEAIAAGVDAIGINFWPKSRRFIAAEEAAPWLGQLAGQVTRVGLFVNATLEEIEEVVDLTVLDAIQLHGDESPDFVEEVSAYGLPIIRAVGVREDGPALDPAEIPTDYLLLDAWAPEEKGGTGRTFRWDIARDLRERFPQKKFILAGGLTADNVATAIQEVAPHGVDTASGVETAPGDKDSELVRAFVEAAHL